MSSVHPVLICALLMQMSGAFAQAVSEEEELALVYGDKSTVSIATGTRQSLRRAPAVATVITAQEIAAMGAVDLDDVLETVPGIHVSRSTQVYSPLYMIRGIHSEFNPQTLMLQNGVPVTTLFVGNRGNVWGGLPVENIARIEVIRGPGSALYGADAFSAVINIITKSAGDAPGTEVGLRAGSFDARDGWVLHGGTLGPVEVAAYLRIGHTDGFKQTIAADAQTPFDALFLTSASLAPGPVNTGRDAVDGSIDLRYEKLRLRAGYKLRDNMETGPGVASALDPVGRAKSERITADLSWNDMEVARDWRIGLTASYLHYTQQFPVLLQLFPAGAFGGSFPNGMFGAPNTWERQVRLSAVSTFSGFANQNLRFGVGHEDLDLYRTQEFKNFTFIASGPLTGLPTPTPDAAVIEFPVAESFLTPHRRKVTYAYVQDEWNFTRDWTLTGGLRHDHYSDFGGTTNPRVALVWDATLDLTAKLLYGRAFRAPAFVEQHSINNPVFRGNPSLRPETINTLEAAFAWQAHADVHVNLSLFRYRMKDIIRTSEADSGTRMFNNVGSQRGHGAELETVWDAGRNLRLSGHYAWQRSINEDSGLDAGYAPRHHLFGRADWGVAGGWLLSGQVNRVAGRRRAPGDVRTYEVPDYTTVDLSLRTSRNKSGWEFAGAVRNLFSTDAREPTLAPGTSLPDDLPLAPRTFHLQATYRL